MSKEGTAWRDGRTHGVTWFTDMNLHTTLRRINMQRNSSDVVLETKVLVSRRLGDKQKSLGLGLGLDKKVLRIFKTFPLSNS